MYQWSIDAREAIKDLSELNDDLIEKTTEIADFLRCKHYFVVATKGLGKSLLLLFKRKSLKGADYIIPQNALLDAPAVSIESLSHDVVTLLYQEDTLKSLWSISIIISILKRLNKISETDELDKLNKNKVSSSLQMIFDDSFCRTPSDIFGKILSEIGRKQFYHDLLNDYSRSLIPAARSINESVAIFIDNVDECFEKVDSREVWYKTQNSLVKSIYQLVRINPKFKIFASIRKEAFLKLKSEMIQQYEGVSLILSYHKDELRQIFIKSIKKR